MATVSESQETFVKNICLDTNALQYLHLYWEMCKESRIDLVNDAHVRELFSEYWEKVSSRERGALRNGQKVLHYLKGLANEPLAPTVYTSTFCWMELRQGLVEIKVEDQLRQARVPFRLRRRAAFDVFYNVLVQDDYEGIETSLNEFEADIKELLGYEILLVEDDAQKIAQVYTIARKVMERVAIGVMDSIVIGAAIVCMASQLITFDTAFRSIVNHQPLREMLKPEVEMVLGHDQFEFDLPIATDLP
jgi:hypothetical protein